MTISKRSYLIGAILLSAFLLRLAQVLYGPRMEDLVWSDMRGYVQIAEMIINGEWQVNHFFQSVGFPLLIVFLKGLTPEWGYNLALINCFVSFLSVVLIWRFAEELMGPQIGLISLIVATVHFPWILLISYSLPESIFTFLLSLCAYMSVKIVRDQKPALAALVWGISFIMAFWLKGTHALWGPLFLCGLLLVKKRNGILPVVALGIPVALGLAIHGFLTYSTIGKVQLSATTGGLNFVEGKCPHKKNRDNAGYGWQSPLYYQLGLHAEKKWDMPFTESGYFFKAGLECIKNDPFTLIQSFESIPFLFYGNTTWPLNQLNVAARLRLYENFITIFFVVGLVVYLVGLKREFNAAEFLVMVTPVLAIFLTSYIFKSEMRYRLPFDVWFIPIAVTGWLSLLKGPRPEANQA